MVVLAHDFFKMTRVPRRQRDEGLADYLRRGFAKIRNVLPNSPTSPAWFERQLTAEAPNAICLADGIVDALDAFLDGDPWKAQNTLDSALTRVAPHLTTLISRDGLGAPFDWLYRVRVVDDLANRTSADLFHIPFEKRHLVGPQRFSLPGIPCLYLGSTTYACWEEFDRPHVDRLVAMGLRPQTNTRILNLAYTTDYLLKVSPGGCGLKQTQLSEFLLAYAVVWPLAFAIHVPRRHKSEETRFVEEYVLPQLLLRWVREHKTCVGLRYFSTKVDGRISPSLASNFVFPTKTHARKGFCTVLTSFFKVTDPIHWSVAKAANLQQKPAKVDSWILVGPKKGVPYINTDFWQYDGMIRALRAHKVK